MIQRFQPYRPWPRPAGDPHPAEMLQALTNDDKHHLLLRDAFPRLGTVRPVRMQRVGYNCRVNSYQLRSMTQRQWVTALMRELKPNTELFRVPLVITGPNPKIDMDIEGATYVAIGPGLSVVNSARCHRQHGQAYPRSLRTRLRPADSQADMERATMARGRAAPAPREYPGAATERHPTVDEASPRHLDSLPSGPYISVSWAQTRLLFAGQICAKSGLIESGMVALLFA